MRLITALLPWYRPDTATTPPPPTTRSFLSVARPLLLFGTAFGAFPFVRSSSPRPSQEDTHLKHEVSQLGGVSDPLPPTPYYVFKICNIRTVVSCAWMLFFFTGFKDITPQYEMLGQQILKLAFMCLSFSTLVCYLVGWVMVFFLHGRLERHFNSLSYLDQRLPTSSSHTIFTSLGAASVISLWVVLSFVIGFFIASGELLETFCFILHYLHTNILSDFWVYLSWITQAHLNGKIIEANKRLKEVLGTQDVEALRSIKKLLMVIRGICDENQVTFQWSVVSTFTRIVFSVVYVAGYMYWLAIIKRLSFHPLAMVYFGASLALAFISFCMTVGIAHNCMRKAKETELLLLQRGDGTDVFSLTISSLRDDLASHPVIFSYLHFFQLSWNQVFYQMQFLWTIALVCLQFSQTEDAQ